MKKEEEKSMAKKRSSKLLSWLLTLVMVLSLAAGMSITAFAQDNDIIVLDVYKRQVLKTVYGQSTFFWLSGEQAGDFPDIIFLHPVIFQGAEAAYHGHTGAALVFHGIDQADDTHFTGQFYICLLYTSNDCDLF